MANYSEMSESYIDLVHTVLDADQPYLSTVGIDFTYLCVDKQPSVIKITLSNPLLDFVTKKEPRVFIILYEEAFEQLSDEYQKLVISNALNSINFNSETGKITIKSNGCGIDEGIYLKYREKSVLALFAGEHSVKMLEEKRKEDKKNTKKNSSK